MIGLADAEAIAASARHLLAERRKYERLSEKGCKGDLTPKQVQKSNADLNWAAMAISKAEAAFHAACVDGGIADLREPSAYAQREFRPSGWHCFPYTPPQPRALNDGAHPPVVQDMINMIGLARNAGKEAA